MSRGHVAYSPGYPLRILKQVVTMFFSLQTDRFHACNPDLVRFVLNKDEQSLPPRYQFFLYVTSTRRLRAIGICARLSIGLSDTNLFSELTFPPFGYVMTIDSPPPDMRYLDITQFCRFRYGDRMLLTLGLAVLPTHLSIPGDYRTKEEIYRDYERNVSSMQRRLDV